MRQSLLIPKAMTGVLWKAECVEMRLLGLGRGQQRRAEKYLAGALLHSEEGGGKRAARAAPRQPPILLDTSVRKIHAFLRTDVPSSQHSGSREIQ